MYEVNSSSVEKTAFAAGIHENVKLMSVSVVELESQNFKGSALKFRFEDKESFFEHTEFPVDEDRAKANALKNNKNPETAYRQDLDNQAKRIAHILTCFIPKEKLAIKAETWEDFCAGIVAALGQANEGVFLRIKLILDNKDYTRFPGFVISPWIQRMDQENKLVINPKYDRVVPKQPDPEQEETAGATAAPAGTAAQQDW